MISQTRPGTSSRSAFDPNRFVRKRSNLAYPLAITLISVGAMIAVAGLAGIDDPAGKGLNDGVAFLLVGAIAATAGLVWSRYYRPPRTLTSRNAMAIATSVWCLMIVLSALAYIVSGELSVASALFESASGITTTGMTALENPAEASTTLLTWRAISQWAGGLGVLLIGFGLLPLYGGAYSLRAGWGRPGPSGTLGQRFDVVARRVLLLYGVFTAIMFAAYLLAGANGFDSFVLSLTTVSTGGFTNRAGSFKLYESAAMQWVAIGGMAVAGSSIAIWWWAFSGSAKRAISSVQLRSYVGLLVVVSFIAAVVNGGDADDVRRSIFTVVSYSSTTGYEVVDAGTWPATLDAILFLLMVVGAMSGSAGGGLHISRIRLLILYLRRVLYHQVHPASVLHVKANKKKVEEYVVANVVGTGVLYGFLVLIGAIGVAAFGGQLHLSFIAAVSALSNVGPVFGVDAAGAEKVDGVLGMSAAAKFVLAGLMIAGRLGVYPALVALGDLVAPLYAKTKWKRHFLDRRRSETGVIEW